MFLLHARTDAYYLLIKRSKDYRTKINCFSFAFVSFQLGLQNVEATMALIGVELMLPTVCLQGPRAFYCCSVLSDFKESSKW